jgi:lipoprotein-anchoring transpeptidase ErfK/SrfK
MRQTRTFQRGLAGPDISGVGLHGGLARKIGIAATVVGTAFAAIVAVVFYLLAFLAPVTASVQDGTTDLSPSTSVIVSVWNLGGSTQSATLTEAVRDIDGKPAAAREIPVQMVPVSAGAPFGLRSNYRIERADGSALLGFDGLYQLAVTAKPEVATLFGQEVSTRDYTFSTLASPRLRLPASVLPLDYQKPVELHWNQSVTSFRVETVPALDTQSWIDSSHGDVSYVQLTGARPGTEYAIRVVDAVAASGARMVAPAELHVLTAAPPEMIAGKTTLEDGYHLVIPWDRAIKGFDYEISPAVQSTGYVGVADPWQSHIVLVDPKQGQEYTVKIKGAMATTGAPLSGTREVKVATPQPLKLGDFLPQQPEFGVPLDSAISIGFSEPVKDRAAAEAAIKITPAVPGKFEWPAPNLVKFVPQGGLPAATDFAVQVAGGRGGVIGAAGGHLDQPGQFTFWTALSKEIEVNLTDQELILWEGGKPIYRTLVSTGVRGAATPTGRFSVSYKMLTTRMRGVNPSGHAYDLPNVPWVMSFLGDYTLHGAYWRDTYGIPQSNGCVSMPPDVAKVVYDWTPVGTAVRIHY